MAIEESIETKIANYLVAKVKEITEIKTVNFEEVRLSTQEWDSHELPAVQFWDTGGAPEHERGRIIMNWGISCELTIRSTLEGVVSQKDLWDLRRAVQRKIWEVPNFGIPGVIHPVYTGTISDLHSIEPNQISRIDFDVRFYDDLTGSC